MPWSPARASVLSNSSDDCSSALDGMQPIFRQVPPRVARFSTQADLQAELRRADGADIAAGAGADDDDVEDRHSVLEVGSGALSPDPDS